MALLRLFTVVALLTICGIGPFAYGLGTFRWNGLRTTFALDSPLYWVPGYTSQGYAPVPQTVNNAIGQNWILASDSCTNGGMFNGFRYIYKANATYTDSTVSPLYDVNGIIAGIQMNILQSEAKANPTNTYKFDDIPMFLSNTIDGKVVYTLTAYFVDPATICTTGRTSADLSSGGTGTALIFQNGTDPSQNLNAPNDRATALAQGWSNNQCFPGMGVHNWYQQEQFQATNCDTILPVFLIYTKQNQLLGFGFQHVGKSYSPRFEHPDAVVITAIVGPTVSPCLLQKASSVGVTTMHVFLIDDPLTQNCII